MAGNTASHVAGMGAGELNGMSCRSAIRQTKFNFEGVVPVPIFRELTVTVGRGYYSEAAVLSVEGDATNTTVFAAMKRHVHGRTVAQLEAHADPPQPSEGASEAEVMDWRLDFVQGKKLYGLRKETVEPVFGIIKEAIGFRRFMPQHTHVRSKVSASLHIRASIMASTTSRRWRRLSWGRI